MENPKVFKTFRNHYASRRKRKRKPLWLGLGEDFKAVIKSMIHKIKLELKFALQLYHQKKKKKNKKIYDKKIFANHMSEKVLVSRIFTDFQNSLIILKNFFIF